MSDRTVRCWGANDHGQLGTGETVDSHTAVAPPIRAVVDLQLADATACALLDDASVACWGRIAWHGRAEDLLRPTGVLGVIRVKQIFVFPGRACARVADDSLVCWGSVDARGHAVAGTNRVPTPVVGLDHVAGMTPDGAFSDDGRMWRWGTDGIPRRIDAADVQEIATREATLCARLDGGRVVCADSGRCSPPASAPATAAAPGATTVTPGATTATSTAPPAKGASTSHAQPSSPPHPGKSTSAVADKAGTQAAAPSGKSAAAKPGTGGATAAAGKPAAGKPAAGKPAAGKPTAGKPAAGQPTAGKLAAGKPTAGSTAAPSGKPTTAAPVGEPAQPLNFPAARQLAFDVGFCVVTTTGRLQCGDGCRKLQPIVLERVTTLVGRCAALKAGTITCFDGAKFVAIHGIQHATSLVVGRAHACALTGTTIACWGDDTHGQLGDFALPP